MQYHRSFIMGCLIRALGILVLAGCSMLQSSSLVASGVPLQTSEGTPENREKLSLAINDFGLDLLRTLTTDSGKNAVLSPVSIHAALSMTMNGAVGETAEQMRRVLHIDGMAATETNDTWADLLVRLEKDNTAQTLEIGNSLWARQGIAFKQTFIATDRDSFGAQLATLDFAAQDAAEAINRWVSTSTHGRIATIVDKTPSNAILYLANTVYLKADWANPFEKKATAAMPFHRKDGAAIDVQMMRQGELMPYAENATVQATTLPYKGDKSEFHVLLPKPGITVEAALADLNGAGFKVLRDALTSARMAHVNLGLPRLDSEYSARLRNSLMELGMARPFDDHSAQFTAMADFSAPIFISDVAHKTRIKITEEGTEAIAATLVMEGAGAAPPGDDPVHDLICDHPYLFAIVDHASGAMLFLGVVNDPTQ